MLIRRFERADWPCLCSIHDAARLEELRLSVGTEAFLSLEETFESEGLFDGTVDVATESGKVVGFVAYTACELTWLYVAPSRARCGIGRALVQHVCDHAGPKITLELLEGNLPALKLYESEGFRVVERKAGQLEGHEGYAAVGLILARSRPP